jgi:hypothetical protein
MPTLKIDITAVTSNGDGTGTGTYDWKSGPGSVTSGGDIDLKAQGTGVDIEWTLTAIGYTFDDPGCHTPAIQQFDAPVNSNANLTCTVDDRDDDLSLKYSIFLKDSANRKLTLDPRIVNR